jgi:RNA polymerase sigma-70 factor (ECF subfamily)
MTSETENDKKLKAFFNKEYHNLKGYVYSRITNSVDRDAEDILQDVALKIFSRADKVTPINNISGFVYHSVKNKIIDIMRGRKQSTSSNNSEALLEEFAELLHQEGEEVYTEELQSELKSVILDLKPHYRDIIIAIDIEGYSYKELSKETGIPTGTLLSRRHRAVSILYKKLKQRIEKNH